MIPKILRDIAKEALGSDYELSVAFVTAKEIQKLNLIYRNKNEPTDILSFPLSDHEGEIYICKSEAKRMGFSIEYLFIHGCVHLKGYDHGAKMESIEAKLRQKFDIS